MSLTLMHWFILRARLDRQLGIEQARNSPATPRLSRLRGMQARVSRIIARAGFPALPDHRLQTERSAS